MGTGQGRRERRRCPRLLGTGGAAGEAPGQPLPSHPCTSLFLFLGPSLPPKPEEPQVVPSHSLCTPLGARALRAGGWDPGAGPGCGPRLTCGYMAQTDGDQKDTVREQSWSGEQNRTWANGEKGRRRGQRGCVGEFPTGWASGSPRRGAAAQLQARTAREGPSVRVSARAAREEDGPQERWPWAGTQATQGHRQQRCRGKTLTPPLAL